MGITPLAQRLSVIADSPWIDWTNLAENVPEWLEPPSVPVLRWEDGDDIYGPSRGQPELLEALAGRCRAQGADLGTESMMVTNGGFDALAAICRLLRTRRVRRIVCAGPILSSVAGLFRTIGLEPEVHAWDRLLDCQGWRTLRLGPTDALYVNTPHNPLGACLGEQPARALLADQSRRGFALVLDLVYDAFQFCGSAGTPLPWIDDWRGIFAFNSFSKNYGAPGLRVGWVMADPAAVNELITRFEQERIAVSSAAQLRAAALCALGNAPLVEAVRSGRELVTEWAAPQSWDLVAGAGGTQAWIDLVDADAERVADLLMERARVVVATGLNYYPAYPRHIRLPTGASIARLATGLAAIDKACRDEQGTIGNSLIRKEAYGHQCSEA
jgi:aspartate aminotransferase